MAEEVRTYSRRGSARAEIRSRDESRRPERGSRADMTRQRSPFCLDCGIDTFKIDHYYMVHDRLWLRANPRNNGMLCLFCLEVRLGRRVQRKDFTAAMVND